MRKLVRDGNRLYFADPLPPPAVSPVYDVPNVITQRARARRGYVRRTGPNGEFVPGGIVESVLSGPEGLLTCQEVEAALIDAAEVNGLPKGDANVRIEELGTPNPKERALRNIDKRGLISYPGKAARKQRRTTGKRGVQAP